MLREVQPSRHDLGPGEESELKYGESHCLGGEGMKARAQPHGVRAPEWCRGGWFWRQGFSSLAPLPSLTDGSSPSYIGVWTPVLTVESVPAPTTGWLTTPPSAWTSSSTSPGGHSHLAPYSPCCLCRACATGSQFISGHCFPHKCKFAPASIHTRDQPWL